MYSDILHVYLQAVHQDGLNMTAWPTNSLQQCKRGKMLRYMYFTKKLVYKLTKEKIKKYVY